MRGWRSALAVLLGRHELRLMVNAEPALVERVLELNPDYKGARGSLRRQQFDAEIQAALVAFANKEARE